MSKLKIIIIPDTRYYTRKAIVDELTFNSCVGIMF